MVSGIHQVATTTDLPMKTVLATNRIRLREFIESDLEDFFSLHSDPEVMRFSSRRTPESRVEAANTLRRLIAMYQETPGLGFWAQTIWCDMLLMCSSLRKLLRSLI